MGDKVNLWGSIQLTFLIYEEPSEALNATMTADRDFDKFRERWEWQKLVSCSFDSVLISDLTLPLSDLFCLKWCRKLLHQSPCVECLFFKKCCCFELQSSWDVCGTVIIKFESYWYFLTKCIFSYTCTVLPHSILSLWTYMFPFFYQNKKDFVICSNHVMLSPTWNQPPTS